MVEKFLARLVLVALFAAVLITVPYSADEVAAQTVDGPVLVNVAVDGVASQSTTSFRGSAARAVDGNTSGVWSQRSVTHTNPNDGLPWWQVELAESVTITSISLWNRTNCCSDRLADFSVFVSDAPFAADATIAQLQADPTVWSYDFDGAAGERVDIPVNARGGFVRIQKPAGTALSLAEVQVFADISDTEAGDNVATNSTASQSTTSFRGAAARAIDGNTSGVWSQRSVTHTNPNDRLPWWQVDLGQQTTIDSVAVWNRTNCCADRLTDFSVFVSSAPFPADATIPELQADPDVWSYSHPGTVDVNVDIPVVAAGRYVRIQKPAGTALSLAEVQVFEAITQNNTTDPGDGDGGPLPPLDIDFNNEPVHVDLPMVEPVIPVQVENPPIIRESVRSDVVRPDVLPDLCSAEGGAGSLTLEFPDNVGINPGISAYAELAVPPGMVLRADVESTLGGTIRGGTGIGGQLNGHGLLGFFSWRNSFSNNGGNQLDTGAIATNNRTEPVTVDIELSGFDAVFRDDTVGTATATNFRFVDADGNETPACPNADLIQCLANGGNLFATDNIVIQGVIYIGCLLFDDPWPAIGLTLERAQVEIGRGVLRVAEDVTASEVFITLSTALSTLEAVSLGCINAIGDVIGSVEDIIAATVEFANDRQAFLNEQYTLIRDTVNAAVQDPNNFVDETLASVLRLELLQEDPARWVGEIGCELLIELFIVIGTAGAGSSAVAVRLTEKVNDFINTRRNNGNNGDGDNNGDGGTPGSCVLRSFSADTEVLLANGDTIDISDVTVGDVVFAHDPETGLSGARAVTAVWPHTDTLVEFEVGDGTVTTTEDHEFWNVTDNAWQETQHIDQGDLLLNAEGETVEAGVLLWDTAHYAPAYDLTVDGIHTYYVTAGDETVLVHNTGCDDAVRDRLDELRNDQDRPANFADTHGPAESVAAAVDADGNIVITAPRYNITNGNNVAGFDVDSELFSSFNMTVSQVDGRIQIPSTQEYVDSLADIYESLGTPLHPDLGSELSSYIDELGEFAPSQGGRYPGTHAEIQAVNDLLNQGFEAAEISVGTTNLNSVQDFLACQHCTPILDRLGITPITGTR